jgi:hypothetical protein
MRTVDDVRGDLAASTNESDYTAVNTLWLALLKLANTQPGATERDRMVTLVRHVPVDEARAIVNLPSVDALLDLDPPLEMVLTQYERGDPVRVQRNIESIRQNRESNPTIALLDLGFVLKRIRDKREHGFKTRYGKRDLLILGAARTVLGLLCRTSLSHLPRT